MSKNVAGILGQQFGKIGPVVARKYRSMMVYSQYQPNVKNPRSSKQTIQRKKFLAMSEIAHNFACGARFGFTTAVKGTNLSARNLFQRVNWPMLTISGADSLSVDYTGFLVAKGGLSNVYPDAPEFDTPAHVKFSFVDNPAACQRTANDKLFCYVFCPDAKSGVLSTATDLSAESVSVKVPETWNGMKVHVWCFTRNEGGFDVEKNIVAGECSDSLYIGSGTIG